MKEKELEKQSEEKVVKKSIKKFLIIESIVLLVALAVIRIFVFPHLAKGGMMHVEVAMHTFMIGLTATLFSFFAITFKKAWKTHGKYVLIPVIFTIFGYLMQILANEVSF